MAREIKFRAWDGKRMLHNVSTGTVCIWGDKGELAESKDCVFMQYTGLNDKNGKEIWESDILLVEDTFTETVDVGIGNVPVAQTPDNHLCEVIFKEGAFRFVVTERGDTLWKGEYYLDDEDASGDFEKIGNIYENKELLSENAE